MIVAERKRKENICEYLLYMWQVEDLIRASDCRIEQVEHLILPRYSEKDVDLVRIKQWYQELIDMMLIEGKQHTGHLDINRVVMMQLEDLHHSLLKNAEDYIYQGLHYQILPSIIQLRAKGKEQIGDLETCFNALYGYLTLRLQGRDISEETHKSIKQISSFLALLAHRYKLSKQTQAEEYT